MGSSIASQAKFGHRARVCHLCSSACLCRVMHSLTPAVCVSLQTVAQTASWPVSSARCSPCAQPWATAWRASWAEPPAVTARPAAAAAAWRQRGRRLALRRRVRPCWIVGYWRTAAPLLTAWRSAWSAAPSASQRRTGRITAGCAHDFKALTFSV